jgi:hypothetical protein
MSALLNLDSKEDRRQAAVLVFAAYRAATGEAESAAALKFAGDRSFSARLATHGPTRRKLERVLLAFAADWPAAAVWPPTVPRPPSGPGRSG